MHELFQSIDLLAKYSLLILILFEHFQNTVPIYFIILFTNVFIFLMSGYTIVLRYSPDLRNF